MLTITRSGLNSWSAVSHCGNMYSFLFRFVGKFLFVNLKSASGGSEPQAKVGHLV